jgi:hypothetical protein
MTGRNSLCVHGRSVSSRQPGIETFALAAIFLTSFVWLNSGTAWGQASTSLRGTIVDPSGGTLAAAQVVLASPESKTERNATTGEQGEYQFLFVPPGTYTLTVTAKGFQRYQITGVQLLVNTPTTMNAQLKVGTATEVVDVTSEQPALNLVDASIGNSFDQTQVRQIPLEGRNVPDLLSLQAGVAYTGNRTDLDKDQDTRNGAVNGARSDQSNITLDGVDVNDQANGYAFTSVLPVTLDSVQEFRVTTTNYGADQGQGSGAQVALVTKSGTNHIHGSAYEYLRNAFTSANDYLVKTAEILDGYPNKPLKLNRNIFGASVGGPIKKDRSFFYLNYEGTRQSEEHSVVRSIPTVAMRDGAIRYLCTLNADGSLNTTTCPGGPVSGYGGANSYSVQPGYWGLSPQDITHIDPTGIGPSQVMKAYFNQTFGSLVTNDFSVGDGLNYSGYRFRAPVKADNNVFIAKFDFHLDGAGKHTLFWRGAMQNLNNPQEPFLPGTAPIQTIADHSKGFALGYTAVLSSSIVNNLRWGFTRESFGVVGNTNLPWNTFIGLDQGHAYSHNLQLPVNNFVDDFSWTRGTHSFQFGGNIGLARNPRVSYLHSNNFTLGTSSWMSPTGIADSASPMDPSNAMAHKNYVFPEVDLSFKSGYDRPVIGLTGIVSDFVGQYNFDKSGNLLAQGAPVNRHYALNWYEMYAQDSWRVKPNLTITYGLRWSLFPPPWETNGLQTASSFSLGKRFDLNVANMKQGLGYTSEPAIGFAPGGPVNHGPGFYHLSKANFAPRISIAFSPRPSSDLGRKIFGDSDKTSIRGGFGMVYDRPGFQLLNAFDQYSPGGFGYTLQNTCCQVGVDDVGDLPRIASLNVIPPNLQLNALGQPPFLTPAPAFSQKDVPFNSEANLWAVDDTLKTPRSYAVDFSIARELPGHFALQISYIGRFGGKLLTQRDLNQPLNIVDPNSGIDYYKAATALSQLARANFARIAQSKGQLTYQDTLTSVTDAQLSGTSAYWHNVLPGLSGGATSYATYCGGLVNPGSAGLVQAVYDVYYNPNCAYVGNEIVGLADIDLYGYLGDNGAHTPFTNPLYFNGPLNYMGTGLGKYLNNQAISAYSWSTVGHSNFNALQASLRKQFSNGVQFDLNYTYSKSLDVTSTASRVGFALVGYQNIGLVGSRLENAFSPDSQYAVSDFDMTHQLNANWLAELPFGKGKRFASTAGPAAQALIGGWQLTGVARWTSGLPFSVDVGQNWPTDWQYTGLAQLVGPKPKTGVYRHSNGSVTIFSNPSASQAQFIIPFPGSGASRNILRGQGYAGLDLGMSKRWRFLESQSVQLTWQVFNVLNLVRFNAQGVGSAVTSIEQAPTQFGTYSSLLTNPRVMQFALRYEF